MGQPQKLGRYELRQTLGRGAMGVVYEGFDPVLGRRVAIKTILPNAALGEDVVRDYAMRFTREAKAAARLSHPNIVQVYDFGAENDLSYLVMEYVDGTELGKFFESGELFDIEDVTRLMTQLLDALELAHNAGIVHRDIKPANVMVDSEGQAKLADFGVARVSDGQDATQVGAMVGTPAYMSPEQVQGQPVDRRTDIFSAGVILYQFLTGQKPFQGGGAYTLARKIIHDDPVMPSALVSSISPAYDRVIRRALAKNVDERYQTAREFSQALNALLNKGSVDAAEDDSTRKISAADLPKAAPAATATGATSTSTMAPIQPEAVASGLELEFWRAIKDSEEIDDFELYLTKFPSGVYAELAQRKVAKLKRATTAAAEEAAALKRQLEEEARARREAEEAARRAAEEKAKLEAQAQAQAQRSAQLKREAEAEAAARRAAEAAAAAAAQKAAAAAAAAKPAVAPAARPAVPPAAQETPPAQPAKKSSMAIPAVVGVLAVAGAAGAYFAMQSKAPVATTAPVAPAQAPVQAVVPAKPEPAPAVAQPAAPAQPAPVAQEPAKSEKGAREVVKAAPTPAIATKPGTDAATKAAASKAAADQAAAKAAADLAAAKTAAEQAAAQAAAAAAAAEQRAAAAEQRAAAAEKAAAERAAAEKVAAERAAAEKAAAAKPSIPVPAVDADRLAAMRAARAKELEWTKGAVTRPRSKAEIEEIMNREGLVPGGAQAQAPAPAPKPAATGNAPVGAAGFAGVRDWQSQMGTTNAPPSGAASAPPAGSANPGRSDCNTFGGRNRNINC